MQHRSPWGCPGEGVPCLPSRGLPPAKGIRFPGLPTLWEFLMWTNPGGRTRPKIQREPGRLLTAGVPLRAGEGSPARGHSPSLLPAPPSSWMLMMPSRAWMRRKAGMNMTRWPCLCERRPRPPPSPPFHCSTSSGKAEVQGHLTDPQVPPGAAAKARGLGGGRKGCLESLPQWPD